MAKDMTYGSNNFFIYGAGGEIISQGGQDGSLRQYYLDDGLGNVRYYADVNGNEVQLHAFDPYGNALDGEIASGINYKDQETDAETGLYFLRARYYNPVTGTFLSRDPVEGDAKNPQTQHGYNYANSNPITLSDPSGLAALGFCTCGSAGAGATVSVSSCDVTTFNAQGQVYDRGKTYSSGPGGSTFEIIGGGKSVYYNWDENVRSVSDLDGRSSELGFWLGPISVAAEKNPETNKINAVEVQVGFSIAPPVGIFGGRNDTWGPRGSW